MARGHSGGTHRWSRSRILDNRTSPACRSVCTYCRQTRPRGSRPSGSFRHRRSGLDPRDSGRRRTSSSRTGHRPAPRCRPDLLSPYIRHCHTPEPGHSSRPARIGDERLESRHGWPFPGKTSGPDKTGYSLDTPGSRTPDRCHAPCRRVRSSCHPPTLRRGARAHIFRSHGRGNPWNNLDDRFAARPDPLLPGSMRGRARRPGSRCPARTMFRSMRDTYPGRSHGLGCTRPAWRNTNTRQDRDRVHLRCPHVAHRTTMARPTGGANSGKNRLDVPWRSSSQTYG